MKKARLGLLLAALVLCGFTCGILLGRNFNRTPLTVSQSAQTQPTATEPKSKKVNINTATAEELTLLPGIGQALAQKIVEYRSVNGPFRHIEDLGNVSGIGQKKLQGLFEYITVGGGL